MAKTYLTSGTKTLNVSDPRFEHIMIRLQSTGQIRELSNLQNGEAGTMVPAGDKFTDADSWKGDVSLSVNPSDKVNVTLNALNDSPDLQFFRTLFNIQANSKPKEFQLFDVIYQNDNTDETTTAEGCWIKQYPQQTINAQSSNVPVNITGVALYDNNTEDTMGNYVN